MTKFSLVLTFSFLTLELNIKGLCTILSTYFQILVVSKQAYWESLLLLEPILIPRCILPKLCKIFNMLITEKIIQNHLPIPILTWVWRNQKEWYIALWTRSALLRNTCAENYVVNAKQIRWNICLDHKDYTR